MHVATYWRRILPTKTHQKLKASKMVRSQTSILAPKSAQTLRAASFGRSLDMAIVTSGVPIMDVSSGRATQQAKNHAIERQKLKSGYESGFDVS